MLLAHAVHRVADGALQSIVHGLLLLVDELLQHERVQLIVVVVGGRGAAGRGRGHGGGGGVGGRRRWHLLDDAVDQVQVLHEKALVVVLVVGEPVLGRWWRQAKVHSVEGRALGMALKMQVTLLLWVATFHDRLVHCGTVLALLLLLWRRCRIRWYRCVLILEGTRGGTRLIKMVFNGIVKAQNRQDTEPGRHRTGQWIHGLRWP